MLQEIMNHLHLMLDPYWTKYKMVGISLGQQPITFYSTISNTQITLIACKTTNNQWLFIMLTFELIVRSTIRHV